MQETYPHAPIVEAVLDIRTRLSEPLSQKSLEDLKSREVASYPTFRQPFQVQFKVERKDPIAEPSTAISSVANGGAMVSADGKQLFQARPDGFSHNRLAPYHDWTTFKHEARRLWRLYREVVRPEFIELLGLNYINKIALPSGEEISDYLRAYIHVPLELPQKLEIHNFQIQVKDSNSDNRVSIGVSFGSMKDDANVWVNLNIQAFAPINRTTAEVGEDEIWTTFEHLRKLKNLAFESCITDKVREGFR